MIHHAADLSATTGQTRWAGSWQVEMEGKTAASRARAAGNEGAWVEGIIAAPLRSHSVASNDPRHHRFLVVAVDVKEARRRVFEPNGKEVDTRPHGKEALQRTGYLVANWKKTEAPDEYKITNDQLANILSGSNAALPRGYCDQQANALHPHVSGRFEFWGEPSLVKPLDLKEGMHVSLRTQGNSVFIETIAKSAESAPDYAGEDVQGGWGAKIMNTKSEPDSWKPPQDELQGVDDDEWND